MGQSKKATPVKDVRPKRRCVIEFLHAEFEPVAIHRRLVNVYGPEAVDVSTVKRRGRRFRRGDRDVSDKQRSGRPCTATIPESEERLDELIHANRRITVNEMRAKLDVGVSPLDTTLSTTCVPGRLHGCSRRSIKTTSWLSVRSCWTSTRPKVTHPWTASSLVTRRGVITTSRSSNGSRWNGTTQAHQRRRSSTRSHQQAK